MKNFNVLLEAAWIVRDVESSEDAMAIALSEAGKLLNPKLDFVEVDIGTLSCAACGDEFMSVFSVANTSLVGLSLEMKVYDAESDEHAARIAKSVIGRVFRDIPLKVVDVTEVD